MNKKTISNIFVCATIGAIFLYAYNQIIHYVAYQVFAGDVWTILLYLLFSYIVAVIVVVPFVWGMKKLKIYSSLSVLMLSTLVIGIVIAYSHNGIILQHLEGFVIGFITGCIFLMLERINASNKAAQMDAKPRLRRDNGATGL